MLATFYTAACHPPHLASRQSSKKDGVQKLHRPRMTSDVLVKDVMTTLMNNVLEFIEYFLGIGIAVRTPQYAVQWNVSDDPLSPRWKMYHEAVVQGMINAGQVGQARSSNSMLAITRRVRWSIPRDRSATVIMPFRRGGTSRCAIPIHHA
jgi:hypothetical protein